MTKKDVLDQKRRMIDSLRDDISLLEVMETGKIFAFSSGSSESEEPEIDSIGICEVFNLESMRLRVLSSDNDRYSDGIKWRNRANIASVDYKPPLVVVEKKELPLWIGRKYVSAELYQILSGKKKLKGEKKA